MDEKYAQMFDEICAKIEAGCPDKFNDDNIMNAAAELAECAVELKMQFIKLMMIHEAFDNIPSSFKAS